MHVCYDNVFALQLHVEGVQVRNNVRQQGYASEPSRVEELISVGKILVTRKDGGDLLHTHGNFAKVKQIAVLHVDQCLGLVFSVFFFYIFD